MAKLENTRTVAVVNDLTVVLRVQEQSTHDMHPSISLKHIHTQHGVTNRSFETAVARGAFVRRVAFMDLR